MKPAQPFSASVQSSVLDSVAYSRHAILELRFRSAVTYLYFAVPPDVVQGLLDAASKGAFFNRQIRDRYPFQRSA